jgi:hypothetical protein
MCQQCEELKTLNVKLIAAYVYSLFQNEEFRNECLASPEPTRASIYLAGVEPMLKDGSEAWSQCVDLLEELHCSELTTL